MARALDTGLFPTRWASATSYFLYAGGAGRQSADRAQGGADFAQVAAQYSVYDATANGGEVGVMPFSAFFGRIRCSACQCENRRYREDRFGDAIQLMQVYRADKPSKHVQVASITYPVEASAATRRDIHNQAGTFSVNAKVPVEAFNDAASAAAVTPRIASLAQGERTIRGLEIRATSPAGLTAPRWAMFRNLPGRQGLCDRHADRDRRQRIRSSKRFRLRSVRRYSATRSMTIS